MTAAPAAIASRSAHSSGAWLLPLRQGTKTIADGAIRLMNAASWPAPLGRSISPRPRSRAPCRKAERKSGSQATGGPSDKVSNPGRVTLAAAAWAALSRSMVSTKRAVNAGLVVRASMTRRQRPGTMFDAEGSTVRMPTVATK